VFLIGVKYALICLVVILLGWGLGQVGAQLLIDSVQNLLNTPVKVGSSVQWSVLFVAILTACIMIFGFGFSQVFALRKVSPQSILRPESGMVPVASAYSGAITVALIFCLLWFYTGSPGLVGGFFGGALALVIVSALITRALLALINRIKGHWVPHTLKLAILNVSSQPKKSGLQILCYAMALCLILVLYVVKGSLISQWQAQLPDDAPNHFLLNIRDSNLASVGTFFNQQGVDIAHIYPLVRGRLTHINEVDVKVAVTKDVGALNRELNLSWRDRLPDDNRILEGDWFDPKQVGDGVSVEQELAEKLGISIGDHLRFNVGGDIISAHVQSLRSVQWDSMQPNFYMLLDKGSLESFPRTYITSVYIPKDKKVALNQFAREFPTISVLELDDVIGKIRGIVSKVVGMLGMVFSLVFAASLLVISAVLFADLRARKAHAGLLRVFGLSGTKLRLSYFIEFFLVGYCAAVCALICTQILASVAGNMLIGSAISMSWMLYLTAPVLSGLALGILSSITLNQVIKASPIESLRNAN